MTFSFSKLMREIIGQPWAIMPEYLAGLDVAAERAPLYGASGERVQFSGGQAVQVIPIVGSIYPRGGLLLEFFGGVSVQSITSRLRAALDDPEVGAILFDVDSPGGQVGGVNELAAEILAARGQKPIIAVANGLAASAAYWLASAADEFVVTPSGEVGSIGVFAVHQDFSGALAQAGIDVTLISAGKYKTEGNPFEPLSEEALSAAQQRVDEYYAMFVAAVAAQRGVTPQAVRDGFGQGRVVGAEQALAEGMVSRIATIDEVVAGLSKNDDPLKKRRDDKRERRYRNALLTQPAAVAAALSSVEP